MAIVGRFAPSPSGRMHLGNLFSALLAWLSVRHAGGTMVLRIEDLDPERCRPEYAAQLKEDLLWLDLDWDVEQMPQSRKGGDYAAAFAKLEARGLIYPCYCSRAQLHAASAPHASDGQHIYPGTCRHLTDAQRAAMTKRPAWRLIVPDVDISFTDGLQGVYTENLACDCGDFILRRADGVYAYQLAVVYDDAEAGVTQVVRGRDLLSSVPRQMYLQQLLGYKTPDYYHVPLLIAPDGRRLSKRERDLDMARLRAAYTPGQVIGLLAQLAGLRPTAESVLPEQLVRDFSWNCVRREDVCVQFP